MATPGHFNDGIDVLFPPEIWIHVFSFLPTRDLYSLLLVDRAFYRFAVPLLYESVYWKTEPRGLLRVLPSSHFLVQDTNNLIGRVRKCTVLKGDDRRCRQTSMPWDSVSPHVRHVSFLRISHNPHESFVAVAAYNRTESSLRLLG
jgi:hypothetical protein